MKSRHQVEQIFEKTKGDRYIWLLVIALSLVSVLAVYSSTSALAFKYQHGDTFYYVLKHFGIIALGFTMMFFIHKINYKYFSRVSQILLWITIPLLIVTLFFGVEINDARRWITIPIINASFQTSDLAKLALIMFLARSLSKKQQTIKDFKTGFIPVMTPPLIVCALIAPSNLSTAAILFTTCLLLMFIGRINMKYIAAMIGAGVLVLGLIIFIALHSDFHARVLSWERRLNEYLDKGSVSYQVEQSKIAIARGGVVGVGPGNSVQRNFLPSPYSDFIFAVVIEEYGFAGGALLVLAYIFFLYRCIRIFVKSPGAFGALLAVGLSFSLVIQAIINMMVVVNLLPVTGVTLPLVSMGGTSLWFTSIAIGIILSVSRNVDQEKNPDVIN